MKTLISDNGGYKLWAELVVPTRDIGQVQLKFSTQYSDAKNPEEFHTQFSTMLSREQLEKLKDMLT